MREAVSGFVFSVYALTMMIFSPIFGKLVSYAAAHILVDADALKYPALGL